MVAPITPENFRIKKVSDHGTSHPVVARIQVQSMDFFKMTPLHNDDNVSSTVFSSLRKISSRLIKCMEIRDGLIQDLQGIDIQQSNGEIPEKRIPQIMQLEERCEAFLQNAKIAITETHRLFHLMLGVAFHKHNAKALYDELIDKLDSNSPIIDIVNKDKAWVKYVIDLRNRVEHDPPLIVNNIEEAPGKKYIAPIWYCDGKIEKATIHLDMDVICSNLFEYAEESFAFMCLEASNFKDMFQFAEIPEEERNSKCPIRLQRYPAGKLLEVIKNAKSKR